MLKARNSAVSRDNSGATVGYEAQLWQMADALRGSMDAAEYKHEVVSMRRLCIVKATVVARAVADR